ILRDSHSVVNGVGGPGRYQTNVGERPRGPSIPLVNRIAVAVELQRPVEVSAFLNGTLSVIFHPSAPENSAAVVVRSLKLEPDVESVHGAAREEVPDLARADDDVDAIRLSRPDGRIDSIQGRR